ncbi:MAG: hypothetical protein B6D36_03545 [Planctomycetes bacterium UTPLA1]|nr:MAG: hypothetical protein B6D36_03545 [Planctomycetes bacterium UTPLA1]
MAARTTVRLSPADDQTLRRLYRNNRVPIDQYRRRPSELARLADAFNAATGQQLTSGQLLHYMIRRRKDGNWETFDGAHRRAKPLPNTLFTDEEWQIVDRLYVDSGIGADTFLYDAQRAASFAERIVAAIGRAIRPDVLAAALVERRKDDALPRLRPDSGFEDIDQVA